MDIEGQKWLVYRIRWLDEHSKKHNNWRRPTHKNIWQGSYDVWSCDQDRLDAVSIPKARMEEALENGLIREEEELISNKYKEIVYHLTETGIKLLETTGWTIST